MDPILAAAQFFADNRRNNQTADNLPAELLPKNLSDAYAIQSALVDQLLGEHGGERVGYKIACTNVTAQKLLNIEAPLFGRLISSLVHPSPASLRAADYHGRVVEPEYAFRMKSDVPGDADYTPESIVPFVGAAIPSIELVSHHFTDWTRVGGLCLAADNAIHGCWVHGEPVEDWRSLDLENEGVRLTVNGELNTTGRGANVLGHPLNVLAWLANELPKFDLQLKAGDYVTTGITTQVYLAEAGDRTEADFGPAGKVLMEFV